MGEKGRRMAPEANQVVVFQGLNRGQRYRAWITMRTMHDKFIMQVGRLGQTRGAHTADDLSLADPIPFLTRRLEKCRYLVTMLFACWIKT